MKNYINRFRNKSTWTRTMVFHRVRIVIGCILVCAAIICAATMPLGVDKIDVIIPVLGSEMLGLMGFMLAATGLINEWMRRKKKYVWLSRDKSQWVRIEGFDRFLILIGCICIFASLVCAATIPLTIDRIDIVIPVLACVVLNSTGCILLAAGALDALVKWWKQHMRSK